MAANGPCTPDDRHAAALARLDRLIALEGAVPAAPWVREWAFSTHFVVPDSARDVASGNVARLKHDQRAEGELIAALRNDACTSLAGRRRILQRHAPRVCGYCPTEHIVCAEQCEHTWPCEEWADAAGEEARDDG